MVHIETDGLRITARCDSCGAVEATTVVRLLDFQHDAGCTGSRLFAFNAPVAEAPVRS